MRAMAGESTPTTPVERYLTVASYHRNAIVERRNIGLRILVGVVTFDLLFMKLALDAADRVQNVGQLAWTVRLAAIGALLTLAAMLYQIEVRSRRDRTACRTAEERARCLFEERDPLEIPAHSETYWGSWRQSWATTWPMLGMLFLTVAIWWLAGLMVQPSG
jgi:hypothetical protein